MRNLTQTKTTNLGFPRIGARRELKKSLETYWAGKCSSADLLKTGAELRRRHWELQKKLGVDQVPCNDFSLYDQVLDMAIIMGVVPRRFQAVRDSLQRYFAMARAPRPGIWCRCSSP
jgi:5-methyltetrahydropteroyltriglutamate--homocysteine methyltransferase